MSPPKPPPGVDPAKWLEGWLRAGRNCPNPECVKRTADALAKELADLL